MESQALLGTLTIGTKKSSVEANTILLLGLTVPSHRQLTLKFSNDATAHSLVMHDGSRTTEPLLIICNLCSDFGYKALLGERSLPAVQASVISFLEMALTGTVGVSLPAHLEERSFLAGSILTVADIAMYFHLSTVKKVDISAMGNDVRRWYSCVAEIVAGYVDTISSDESRKLVKMPKAPEPFPDDSPGSVNFVKPGDDLPMPGSSSAPGAAGAAGLKKGDKKDGPDGGKKELTEEQKARAKAAAEKKAAKKKEKAKAPAPAPAATADYDFSALDIRVGKILKAWEHESAEKLYCEEIDVGEEKPRQIASGLRPFYKLEEMQNRRVIVLCNLKARNLVGFPSHGMVMCASSPDHTQVEFVEPPEDAPIGERITVEGCEGEPETEQKIAKKKIFEKLVGDLKTIEGGVASYKGKAFMTTKGPAKAAKGMVGGGVS